MPDPIKPTAADDLAAARALGYKTVEDATDYRNTGEEDRRFAFMRQAFALHARQAREQGRQEGREQALEEAARVADRRRDARFDEYGTREPDTNATYYSGLAGEIYESLDEEDEEIATAILALKDQPQ